MDGSCIRDGVRVAERLSSFEDRIANVQYTVYYGTN